MGEKLTIVENNVEPIKVLDEDTCAEKTCGSCFESEH